MTIEARIYHQATATEQNSPLNGDVQALCSAVGPLFGTDGGHPTAVERVRNFLNSVYAGKVTEQQKFGPQYEVHWNPSKGAHCVVCTFGSVFEVAMASGVVVLDIKESSHY